MSIDSNKIKYVYIRNENKFPVGCIAYVVSDKLIQYGTSTYCPKDKFSRRLARNIASGRLISNPHGFATTANEPVNRMLADLCSLLHKNENTPTRIRKCLPNMRKHFLSARPKNTELEK